MNKNYIKEVAKILNVEMNEPFKIQTKKKNKFGYMYTKYNVRLTEKGLCLSNNSFPSHSLLGELLSGIFEIVSEFSEDEIDEEKYKAYRVRRQAMKEELNKKLEYIRGY
jgi:Mn-dependent DtxR family transcriptional regulator